MPQMEIDMAGGWAGRTPWGADLAVPIGLGTNTFGRTSGPGAAHAVLDRFTAAGGTLIDTADTYSDGTAEAILGDWLRRRGRRDQVVIATKVGNRPPFDNLSRDAVSRGLDDSLRRLGVEHIDLYFAHYQDDGTPLEESVAAFDRAVRAGMVRAAGLSNFDAPTVQRWVDVARAGGYAVPVALQPHYSLVHRQPFESDHARIAAAAGLAVLPYRALAGGFLTGKYRTVADTDGPARGPNVRPLLTAAGLALLDALDAVAANHSATPAAIAVAWLLHQPSVTAPLVSATSPDQLDDALGGSRVRLVDADLRRLAEAADAMGS